ncbi:MAG: hypothetical protein IIC02_05375 [Planctomycetes bacterium]|nr:hypothetical protein [Planctomycetota bacterium]
MKNLGEPQCGAPLIVPCFMAAGASLASASANVVVEDRIEVAAPADGTGYSKGRPK